MIGLKYIGRKTTPYADPLYSTGLEWADHDSVVWADEEIAAKFLRHPDVWVKSETKEGRVKPAPVETQATKDRTKQIEEDTEVANLPPLVALETMEGSALRDFAQRNFGAKLHPNMSETNMRAKIRNMMNSPMTG